MVKWTVDDLTAYAIKDKKPKKSNAGHWSKRIPPKTNAPYESDEQICFFEWLDLKKIRAFAIPNANSMSWLDRKQAKISMGKLKREGLKKGVLDIMIPIPKGCYHGLFIEMKRSTGGVVSPEQKEWIEFLTKMGYYVKVCKGASEAIETTEKYMQEK